MLFFRNDETMMAVPTPAPGESFGRPVHLFDLDGLTGRYDISVDEPGFFVILDSPSVRPNRIEIVFNFFEELRAFTGGPGS